MYLFYLPKGESGGGNAFPSLRGGAGGDIAADLRVPFQTPFERGISPAPGSKGLDTGEHGVRHRGTLPSAPGNSALPGGKETINPELLMN